MLKYIFNRKVTVPEQTPEQLEQIKQMRELLGKIPTGRKMLAWLDERNITIAFKPPRSKEGGSASFKANAIFLTGDHSIEMLTTILAHEARHFFQMEEFSKVENTKKTLGGNFARNPFAFLTFFRLIEADAFSFQHLILCELMTNRVFPDGHKFMISGMSDDVFKKIGRPRNEMDMEAHRVAAYETFFTGGLWKYYDIKYNKMMQKMEKMGWALERSLEWIDRFTPKSRLKTVLLKEAHIRAITQTAWGELPHQNYMFAKEGMWDEKALDIATSEFQENYRDILKMVDNHLTDSGLNTYYRSNGTTRKLINFN